MKKWYGKGFTLFISLMGIVIVGALGLQVFSSISSGSQPDFKQTPIWKAYFDLPAKSLLYRRYIANYKALWHSAGFFAMGEKRLPRSFEELVNSVYFPVSPSEFLNPYTGKPVQNIPEPKMDIREVNGVKSPVVIDKNVTDVLGNLTFKANPEEVHLIMYFQLDGEEGVIRGDEHHWKAKTLIPTPGSPLAGVAEDTGKFVKPSTLTPEDRRLYYRCEYIRLLVGSAQFYGFKTPLSWEELKATGIVLDIKNPYTEQPIQDVSYYSPSPGNFTYIIFDYNNPTESESLTAHPICFNRELKSVNPLADMILKQHLQWEAEGTFRNKNNQPVKKLVLIH